MLHHFTVDVEEYFQVSAFEPWVHRDDWGSFESRIVGALEHLLEALDRHQATATFFTLGWIAKRNARIIKRIADCGHEVASHGWDHRRVTELDPADFRESVRKTKDLLEQISGHQVIGFRAPSFSIVPGREWALEILVDEGYRYDSSLFPVSRRGYGYPHGERHPHWLKLRNGKLHEVPPATVRLFGKNLPAAGGAYFRLFPYSAIRAAFRQAEREGLPATFYIHPWELDPEQPRLKVGFPTRIRHYGGLRRTRRRLERLLSDFRFSSIVSNSVELADLSA